MFDLVIFFVFGLVLGILSGLVPGLHPNLVSAIIILQNLEYENKAIIIVSMYAGHIVFSYVPAIFFGIPDEQTAISVLPGQKMAREGKGITALKTIVVSVLIASGVSVLFIPLALQVYPILYTLVKPHLILILVAISAFMIIKTKNPFYSLLIFLAAGFFGACAFKIHMIDVFLPLFSGFFAMGAILTYKKSEIAKQKEQNIDFGIIKYALFGAFFGALANLIPATSSPAQVAALISVFIPFETLAYLAAISAISVGQFLFALASSVSIDKARHGVIVNLGQIINIEQNMQIILIYFLFGIALSASLIYILRKKISLLANIDFAQFNKLLALYLLSTIFLINGVGGVVVFAISSLIGYITIKMNVERTIMMSAIIVPTIILIY
ncbi:MAG: tripartite tricarboxylate transporter permease [Candidatus Micrarchaeota archaeon]